MGEIERARDGQLEIGAKVAGDSQDEERIDGDGSSESAGLARYAGDVVAREYVVEPLQRTSDCKCGCCSVI